VSGDVAAEEERRIQSLTQGAIHATSSRSACHSPSASSRDASDRSIQSATGRWWRLPSAELRL